jgi:hypothetical protein
VLVHGWLCGSSLCRKLHSARPTVYSMPMFKTLDTAKFRLEKGGDDLSYSNLRDAALCHVGANLLSGSP